MILSLSILQLLLPAGFSAQLTWQTGDTDLAGFYGHGQCDVDELCWTVAHPAKDAG